MRNITFTPIGVVRSTRQAIADDNWDVENARIQLDAAQFSTGAFSHLDKFSHAMIVFYMDRADPAKTKTASRHPRGNPAWPTVGIFAQRAKDRPNPLGVTICEILKIEDRSLHVVGLDAIDGTPVLDIKPWVAEFGPRGGVFQPEWMSELMGNYWIR